MNDILETALTQLDEELAKRNLNIEIVICGAYALHLLGYSRSEYTLDVDSITELQSSEVKQIIETIGQKLGLGPYWLNDQASTVSLPKGVLSRAIPFKRWKSINASLVSRIDLIKMKASAFSIRRDQTNKDWEDLILLMPTAGEIDEAIIFIKETNAPPMNASKQILTDFEETLRDLKKFQNKMSFEEFRQMAHSFGIAIQLNFSDADADANRNSNLSFMDIELFFLSATFHLKTSRVAEGFLCWLLKFGHLLSPSKIRRLILSGYAFDSAVLGGFTEFLIENHIMPNQWKIIKPFCKKRHQTALLLDGPTPRLPSSYFLKYRIMAPQFKLDTIKFLLPTATIYKNSIELRNRALFGSVVNADVASYLQKNPGSTPYQIARNTHHHKARVFEVYLDVLDAS